AVLRCGRPHAGPESRRDARLDRLIELHFAPEHVARVLRRTDRRELERTRRGDTQDERRREHGETAARETRAPAEGRSDGERATREQGGGETSLEGPPQPERPDERRIRGRKISSHVETQVILAGGDAEAAVALEALTLHVPA